MKSIFNSKNLIVTLIAAIVMIFVVSCGGKDTAETEQTADPAASTESFTTPDGTYTIVQGERKFQINVMTEEVMALLDDEVLEGDDDDDDDDEGEEGESGNKNKNGKTDEDGDDDDDDEGNDDAEGEQGDENGNIKACANYFGGEVDVIKVTGSENEVNVEFESVLAIRIAGNMNVVNVSIEASEPEPAPLTLADEPEDNVEMVEAGGDDDDDDDAGDEQGFADGEEDGDENALPADLTGICFFQSGNGSTANVAIAGFDLGKFGIIARGNQAKTNLDVAEGSSVADFFVDFSGNGPVFTITGDGNYDCPEGEVKGQAAEVPIVCQ